MCGGWRRHRTIHIPYPYHFPPSYPISLFFLDLPYPIKFRQKHYLTFRSRSRQIFEKYSTSDICVEWHRTIHFLYPFHFPHHIPYPYFFFISHIPLDFAKNTTIWRFAAVHDKFLINIQLVTYFLRKYYRKKLVLIFF